MTCLTWVNYFIHMSFNLFFLLWQNLYRGAGLSSLPTGYRLPVDTPHFKHSKNAQYMSSYVSAVLIKMGSEVGGGHEYSLIVYSHPPNPILKVQHDMMMGAEVGREHIFWGAVDLASSFNSAVPGQPSGSA